MPLFSYLLSFCILFLTLLQCHGKECGVVDVAAVPWSNKKAPSPTKNPSKHYVRGGKRFLDRSNIKGIEASKAHAMPWLVLMQLPYNRICTGSLIASRFVLTAKHCVADVERSPLGNIMVGYGNFRKNVMHQVGVVEILDHPSADLSILKLNFDVHETSVCLPKQFNAACHRKDTMVIAGFGRYVSEEYYPDGTRNGTLIRKKHGNLPDFALWTNIKHFSKDRCTLNKKSIDKTEFCAGGFGSGSMDGDSGGPVMRVIKKRVIQLGVTSRGFSKAINGKVYDAGVYVNVGKYAKWIAATTNGTAQFRLVPNICKKDN